MLPFPCKSESSMGKPHSHFLLPGEIFASREGCMVKTVLGSCVALCLWDRSEKIGGINHYMLPLWGSEGRPTSRYGDVAIDELLHEMAGLGCRRQNLVAKIFGGASMIAERNITFNIGERNMQIAEQMMTEYGIPIVASDTGGTKGRRLIFNTATGVVSLRKTTDNGR